MRDVNTCSCVDCEKRVHGHGLCMNHYLQARRRKELPHKLCSITGCDRVGEQKGLCYAHFFRISKYGDPERRLRVANGELTDEGRKATALKCQQNYRKTPHGKLRVAVKDAKRRLRDGKALGSITREQSAALWATNQCALCGTQMADVEKSIDHIIPLSRGGSNDMRNLQMVHLACNQSKSNRLAA